MPVYDFKCEACPAERRVSVSADAASSLSLVCIKCGGSMHLAPVLKVAFVAAHWWAAPDDPARSEEMA